jgi:hypothetical protein
VLLLLEGASAEIEVLESRFVLITEDAVTALSGPASTAEAVFPDDDGDGCSVTAA